MTVRVAVTQVGPVTHINLAKGFRGGERQTLNLIEGCRDIGIEQALVCRRGAELGERARAVGCRVLEIANPLMGHGALANASINHVHEARGVYWAMIEYIIRKTPYVITRRIPNPVSGSFANRYAYRNATSLVGVSQDVANRLTQQTGHASTAILDSCTPLTVDSARVQQIRNQLGVTASGGPIIGHVGALFDHHKGQSVLIDAFKQLLQTYPDARLLLVGEGDDRARFEQQAGGDPRIVFAGFQADVGNWMAAMDVFAFPSREEGLGSSVLDAMMLNVPVIMANVGGLPELAGDGERALMLSDHDPANWARALQTVLEHSDATKQRAAAARLFAQSNDIAAMTRQYLDVYRSITSDRAQLVSAASA